MKLSKHIQPQGDKILVLPILPDTKTESGILLQANAKGKKSQMGEVLAISDYLGQVWMAESMPNRIFPKAFVPAEQKVDGITVGDKVLFAEYSGDDIQLKDLDTGEPVTVKILPIENILGIVTDPD